MKKVDTLYLHQFQDKNSPEDFYVNTLQEHVATRHKDIALPHKHNFYLSVLFTKGSGTHEIDFTSYTVNPGALFFLNPGQIHHWELSSDTEGYIFIHSQGFYNLHYNKSLLNSYPFFYSMHNSPMLHLKGETYRIVEIMFRELFEENERHEAFKTQKLLSLIDLIYIESSRIYIAQNDIKLPEQSLYSIKFRQLEELINHHYREKKSPSQYAAMLNMSAKHLNRITQAVAGKTTSDVILDRVLLEAKKELLLQQKSFGQIAEGLGYDDYAYFSRLFKKKAGDTPSGFIERYRNN
jgi:AraC family transcriptional activator of pobA